MRIRIVLSSIMCGLAASGATVALAAPARHESHAAHPSHASAAPVAAAASGASSGWSPAQCGREPAAPTVDTSTVDRYNASVDRVTGYEKAARSYNGCVSRAATTQQTAISNDARTRIDAIQAVSSGLQKRIAGNFETLTTALRAGAPKLQASTAAR